MKNIDELKRGCHLQIAILGREQNKKIIEAVKLLKEAGVTFDYRQSHSTFDFELDWSLKGAKHDSIKCQDLKQFAIDRCKELKDKSEYEGCQKELMRMFNLKEEDLI